MQCVVGCVCKAGYYKDKNGNCIDPKQCPGTAFAISGCLRIVWSTILGGTTERCSKPHQKYEECGTACPPSCKTPKPEACTEQCVKGCFCEPGYVLDDQGNCVDPKRCPGSGKLIVSRFCPLLLENRSVFFQLKNVPSPMKSTATAVLPVQRAAPLRIRNRNHASPCASQAASVKMDTSEIIKETAFVRLNAKVGPKLFYGPLQLLYLLYVSPKPSSP